MTELEQSLSNALSYARVPELPQSVDQQEGVWTKAIILVKKYNNRQNYAVAHNDGNGNPLIVADFGPSCGIKEIVGIYPYSFVTKAYTPNLKTKDDIVAYLVNHGENEAEIRQLISDKHPNNRAKAEARKKEDNEKIKSLVAKYSLKDENRLKSAVSEACSTEFYDKELPEIEPAD